ncbi:sensor histidine kinase [Trebonia kvetii]|uniref:sensor histidine kinase n=1 Tax=Trebonia kvetii TaxID=2480626 RepID=UPI001652AADF|nr:HAMP domain-containing sensor histidine kinase [Trebonia kvetii]
MTLRWRPFASVRSRILGWSVLLLAAAFAASTVAMHVLLVRQLDGRVSAELTHEIAEFRALEAQRAAGKDTGGTDGAATSMLALLRAKTSQAVLEPDTVLVGLMGGRIVAISGNSSTAALGVSPAQLASWSALAAVQPAPPTPTAPHAGNMLLAAGPAQYQAVSASVPGTPVTGVFVAIVLTGGRRAGIARITQLQAEVGAVALLLGAALAWVIAGRLLRPLRDTTELARRITDTDISGRIPIRGPARSRRAGRRVRYGGSGGHRGRGEIGELAHTLNRMLDRLESALTTQRRFLADAGHELRTPITIIQGNLDTLTAVTAEDAQTLTIVSDELTRMARLVDELALLARSEWPDFLRPEPTDITALTVALAAKARVLDPADDTRITLTGTAAGVAVLDPQRITQAVMQLAANAVAHTPPGTRIEIGSAIAGGRVEFRVADHGIGIPPEQRDLVFQRFARLDSRRTDGTGLGLSIVAAIAAAHGGSVRLAETSAATPASAPSPSAQPWGGGAAFVLSIPLRHPAASGPYPDPPLAPPRGVRAAAPAATISAGAAR